MANKKVKHVVAKLLGSSEEETLDIYDEAAVHESDVTSDLNDETEWKVLSAAGAKRLNDKLEGITEVYLDTSGWGTSYPYEKTVSVEGVTPDTVAIASGVKYPDTVVTKVEKNKYDKAASLLMSLTTGENVITFKAVEPLQTAITVCLRGI